MSKAYDSYDYRSYWEGRRYEHESEMVALSALFKKIPNPGHVLDVGCGFGRLAPSFIYNAASSTFSDPSKKLLMRAKSQLKIGKEKNTSFPKVSFVEATLTELAKLTNKTFDTILCVRVVHHIDDIESAIKDLSNLASPEGYLILEFANKLHAKAMLECILKGDLTFPLEIFPKDRRSKQSKKRGAITFVNHHPDLVNELIEKSGFKILERRSVSNGRSRLLKKAMPKKMLSFCERCLQRPLARLNFGPSMFVLAQKTN